MENEDNLEEVALEKRQVSEKEILKQKTGKQILPFRMRCAMCP